MVVWILNNAGFRLSITDTDLFSEQYHRLTVNAGNRNALDE